MAVYGSPEYALTWKHWDMQSGPPICALRASGRRTSDSGCGGWGTPLSNHANGTPEAFLERKRKSNAKNVEQMGVVLSDLNMQVQAWVAGWPTPTKGNADGSQIGKGASSTGKRADGSKATVSLNQVAQTAGWPTPLLGRQVSLSTAQTEKRAALNPRFSLWLMGYRTAWALCAERVTRSSRKSRRNL
jgi:hypothetical protein